MTKIFDPKSATLKINGHVIKSDVVDFEIKYPKFEDEWEKFRENFQSEMYASMGVNWADTVGKDHMHDALIYTVTEHIRKLNFSEEEPKVSSQTLWDAMDWKKKLAWHLFRRWPFKAIADEMRRKVWEFNNAHWEEKVVFQMPDILQEDPKRVVVMTIALKGPIQSVDVEGKIDV